MEQVIVLIGVADRIHRLYNSLSDEEKNKIKEIITKLTEKIKERLKATRRLSNNQVEDTVYKVEEKVGQLEVIFGETVDKNRTEQNSKIKTKLQKIIDNPEDLKEKLDNLEKDSGIEPEQEHKFIDKVKEICSKLIATYQIVLDNDEIMQVIVTLIEQSGKEIQINHLTLTQQIKEIITKEIGEAKKQLDSKSVEQKGIISGLIENVNSEQEIIQNYSIQRTYLENEGQKRASNCIQ